MKKLLLTILSTAALFALNINTATKDQLMQIKGIGPKKAQAIIKYRKTHKIKSLDELKNIKGINSKILLNIKNNIKKSSKTQSKKVDKNKKSLNKKLNTKIKHKNKKIKNSKSKLKAKKLKKTKTK